MAFEDPTPDERPVPRWRQNLTLPVLLLVGLLLYELTAQPALGVAAVCVKFGWEDFRTAWWLWWKDPRAGRARACFWLYVASALWKIAITGSVMLFAFAFVRGLFPQPRGGPRPGPPPHVLGAIVAALVGYGLSTVATLFALLLAWWYGVRLWLDGGVHEARRQQQWPPPNWPGPRSNGAGRLVITALILTVIPAVVGALAALAFADAPPQRPVAPGARPALHIAGGVLACLVGGPIVILIVRDLLARRILASAPSECWGTEPDDGDVLAGVAWAERSPEESRR